MDRIEERLERLLDMQECVTLYTVYAGGSAQVTTKARDALRSEIAADWRAWWRVRAELVELLERIDPVLEQAGVDFELRDSHSIALARLRIASTLARVKGES